MSHFTTGQNNCQSQNKHRPISKWADPALTANGEERAQVSLQSIRTLWFNTGTLCNIECLNCYIKSSPRNDQLVYLRRADIEPYLDELDAAGENPIEIGFTGGEPFMAPEIIQMLQAALMRGHKVLILTNAMRPMQRPHIWAGLVKLQRDFANKISLRVSLDHYSAKFHDTERGQGGFAETLKGMKQLAAHGFRLAIAGRRLWNEKTPKARAGYARLIAEHGFAIDVNNPLELVLFPEMQQDSDPPEISVSCWSALSARPEDQMCASQRMVVRRKGDAAPIVLACTLIPYDRRFEMGGTLAESRNNVVLNHPYCASFCVLGGGSCSA